MQPGVRLTSAGAEVLVYSANGQAVFVCLFDDDGAAEISRVALKPRGDGWHGCEVEGFKAGTRYGFRVDGEWNPDAGLMFDPSKLLLDPYTTALDRPLVYHDQFNIYGIDTAPFLPKCVAQAPLDDIGRKACVKPQVVYEVSVKAFSKLHPGVPEAKRGTVAALAEPSIIAHFKSIGVDTIELMPICAWMDEKHLVKAGLKNAWGYNTVSFLAPDPRLAPGGMAEIRQTVEALHKAGLQVILDMVFNHTAEGDLHGPSVSYRGLDSVQYYAQANGVLFNDTGCGNQLALDRTPSLDLALASMRHWVLKAGVDGFRFDLAPVMGRTIGGFSKTAPLLKAMQGDPVLSSAILIAEPWDIGPGGYQLGNFPDAWMEWNDKYRDEVRKFWRGDSYSANALATRLSGSSDIFGQRKPSCSVNFLAAHDGFTLFDLVTFREKNNFANGEDNRDGKSDEVTWPGGNAAAMLACLMLSRGTAMITAGDEFGRTQKGNNNAYAQDNDITWLHWDKRDTALEKFVGELVALRRRFAEFFDDAFLNEKDSQWFGADGQPLDWADAHQRILGVVILRGKKRLAIVINGTDVAAGMNVHAGAGLQWKREMTSGNGENCPPQSVSVFVEG